RSTDLEDFRPHRVAVGLHADDFDARPRSLQRRGGAADQPPTAYRHDHPLEVMHLVQKLEPEAAVSGDDLGVGERMQERLRLIPPLFRSQPGQELIARHEYRRCSPALDALNLRWRSRVEHENSAWNAETVRRVSPGLGGVSGANRDQPPAELPRRKGQGGREKAADLEATCRLEALEL